MKSDKTKHCAVPSCDFRPFPGSEYCRRHFSRPYMSRDDRLWTYVRLSRKLSSAEADLRSAQDRATVPDVSAEAHRLFEVWKGSRPALAFVGLQRLHSLMAVAVMVRLSALVLAWSKTHAEQARPYSEFLEMALKASRTKKGELFGAGEAIEDPNDREETILRPGRVVRRCSISYMSDGELDLGNELLRKKISRIETKLASSKKKATVTNLDTEAADLFSYWNSRYAGAVFSSLQRLRPLVAAAVAEKLSALILERSKTSGRSMEHLEFVRATEIEAFAFTEKDRHVGCKTRLSRD